MTDVPRQQYHDLQRVGAIIDGPIDSKPCTHGGVTMRSQLEADFARHLDSLGVAWTYEPRVFGRKGSGYLPDFHVSTPGADYYIEVKPTLAEVPLARTRMEAIWGQCPNAILLIACAEGCTFWAASLDRPEWESFVDRWKHA
jgi:hypothetical protein